MDKISGLICAVTLFVLNGCLYFEESTQVTWDDNFHQVAGDTLALGRLPGFKSTSVYSEPFAVYGYSGIPFTLWTISDAQGVRLLLHKSCHKGVPPNGSLKELEDEWLRIFQMPKVDAGRVWWSDGIRKSQLTDEDSIKFEAEDKVICKSNSDKRVRYVSYNFFPILDAQKRCVYKYNSDNISDPVVIYALVDADKESNPDVRRQLHIIKSNLKKGMLLSVSYEDFDRELWEGLLLYRFPREVVAERRFNGVVFIDSKGILLEEENMNDIVGRMNRLAVESGLEESLPLENLTTDESYDYEYETEVHSNVDGIYSFVSAPRLFVPVEDLDRILEISIPDALDESGMCLPVRVDLKSDKCMIRAIWTVQSYSGARILVEELSPEEAASGIQPLPAKGNIVVLQPENLDKPIWFSDGRRRVRLGNTQ